jgi:hypothetical protein
MSEPIAFRWRVVGALLFGAFLAYLAVQAAVSVGETVIELRLAQGAR